MEHTFKVGDMVVLVNDPTITPEAFTKYNGEEAEVVEGLAIRFFQQTTRHAESYVIRCRDGKRLLAAKHEIKPATPPKEWTGEKKIMDMFLPKRVTEGLV